MPKRKRTPRKEKIEERVVDLLSNLMSMVQDAESGKIQGLVHHVPFNNCKVEILELLQSPLLEAEKRDTYKKSYTALSNQALKIYLRPSEQPNPQTSDKLEYASRPMPTQRTF